MKMITKMILPVESLYEFSTRFLSKMICGTDHKKKVFFPHEFLYESLTNSYLKMIFGNDYKKKVYL